MAEYKSQQQMDLQPPRILEYSPHFGPEGQTFTVTLQYSAEKPLRIGFGTLVVDTKQYAANGYVTLSCTVPSFATTKWFVNKVPLYVLQMENDMVMQTWPFGDYSYYEDHSKRLSTDKMIYNQTFGGQSALASKRQHMVPDLDLSQTIGGQSQPQQLSPLTPTSMTGGIPHQDDYASSHSGQSSPTSIGTPSFYNNAGIYSQTQQQQPTSPYGARSAMGTSYARSGYYNTNQMMAPHVPSYSQADMTYAMTTAASHNNTYIQNHAQQPMSPTSYIPQTQTQGAMTVGGYNPYANMLNKACLKFSGNMEDMAMNWSNEEWESRRRLVQFWRRQDGNDIHCTFAPVAPADRQPNSIVISCIYWAEKNECFLTSVDCIYLLESLIAVRFTVEEKNRIRRNLEGFRPVTVSKCKPDSAEFFKLIMSFPNPKPRNIEKDVKVFPWKVLPYALKKIISKYTASYSSPSSMQTDTFYNASFPHGSTLPLTPQQQSIIESSLIL